ncbi:MAG TPA: PQQ-binding-like beta-propeller repeat protein [Pyrinomonadaceae bacterium]|nr:PQQ-binding-like beta-propeller repeat protein [Pyrinomonadaceae bacterium]
MSLYRLFFSAVAVLCLVTLPFSTLAREEGFALSQPLTVRWQYQTERTVNLTPAVRDGLIYLPLTAGTLLSLRGSSGELLWKEETGGEFSAAPLADEQGVYVATEVGGAQETHFPRATGALRALSSRSGITRWMRTLQSPLRGALAASEKMIFAGAADGRVYAFGKERGEVLWMSQFKATFNSQPILSAGRLYIGGEDGNLYALEQETGRTVWRYQTRGALRGPVSVAEGTIFFGSADNYVYALREADGRLRWRSRTGAEVQAVAYTSQGLVVASLDNFVYLLSLRRGARVWKRQLAGRIASQPLASFDGALFAPLSGDACVVLDLKDGKQVNNLPVGEGNNMAASPVASGQMLLVTTRQGLLAFASSTNGKTARAGNPRAEFNESILPR